MKSFKIALVPGDGVGKEVVEAAKAVLQAAAQREAGVSFEREDGTKPGATKRSPFAP